MRSILTIPLLLLLVAAEPKEVRVAPCKLVEIKVEGKEIVWRIPPGVEAKTYEGGKLLVAVAPVGRYPLLAATTDPMGKLILLDFTLIVEGIEPVPPPLPSDPLRAELKALYAADTGADKAANVVKLAAVYSQAAAMAKTDSVTTAFHLADAVRAVSKSLLPPDVLIGLRARCNGEVGKALNDLDPDAPLTTETRKLAAELYGRIAAAIIEGATK